MDLFRHLRYFLVVAEELHFSRAAEVLGMAQPPLSQAMRRLERELGVTLFDRLPRGTALTGAGQALVEEARQLLFAEQRLRTVMRATGDGSLGVLRAGVPPDTPAPVLGELLRRLAARFPGLDVDLQELTTAEQVAALAAARLDAGLVQQPVDRTELRAGPVTWSPLGVVLPRTAALARAAAVPLADLAGHGLVLFPRATAPDWYDRILAVSAEHGFHPARVRHARSPELLCGLVLAGQGVALAREDTVRREPRVAWRPLRGEPLRQGLVAVWPRRAGHPAAPRFAELAAEVLAAARTRVTPVGGGDPAPAPWSVVFDAARS
ncbi:LysR substrate-binding domain-containing protein [Actinoplanes oblitus]|uniref:LysR substrate-binding domain-containing protein n=1 Tax=Actinoplanes oblitus TaxID=3040509 RepID=A0ABY8WJA1_9ACTN|nr:LysR substrate-binding domain-containing protein [Actinoplanes oblitus]WIM97959.1 LysR substrate-binding domain-containing protein [Actinoplanes oblitus]